MPKFEVRVLNFFIANTEEKTDEFVKQLDYKSISIPEKSCGTSNAANKLLKYGAERVVTFY